MPNYEYECTQCAHRFEIWQPVGEAAPACEQCQSEVRKIFHAPRIIFKGSGFYLTDLRAEKEKASAGKNSAAKSDSGESSSASSSNAGESPKSEKSGDSSSEKTAPSSETKTDSTTPASGTTAAKK